MENVWGTKVEGIGTSLTNAMSEQVPKYGGIMMQCVITARGETLRARDGWILELASGAMHMRFIGSDVHAMVALDTFRYYGDEPPHTPEELAAANESDRANYRAAMADLVQRHRESQVDAEFDRLFNDLQDYDDAPHIEYTVEAS